MENAPAIAVVLLLSVSQFAFAIKPIRLYEGPPLPPDKIATINEGNFQVLQIDKISFVYDKTEGLFELLPGEHTIYFKGKSQQSNSQIMTTKISTDNGVIDITANLKEGLHYEIVFYKLSGKPDKSGTYPIIPVIKNDITNDIFLPETDLTLKTGDAPNDESENKTTSVPIEFGKIPKTNEYAHSRWEAIQNVSFNDQAELLIVAKTDSNEEVRKEAVRKLSNQVELTEIAKTDRSEVVRWAAVVNRNLTDQILFADLAQNAKDEHVRRYAVNKITNKELLAEIFKVDKNRLVREAAKDRLNELSRK